MQALQDELESTKQEAEQAKAQAMELAKQVASLNSELEKINAQRMLELEKANAQRIVVDGDLSSYVKIGDVLMAQGNLAEALKSYRDGLAVGDRLTKADPENAVWQRDVSHFIQQGRRRADGRR